MSQFQLFGITEAGETAFCELLGESDRAGLRALAAERLGVWHAVEVWEGPVCLLRLAQTPRCSSQRPDLGAF